MNSPRKAVLSCFSLGSLLLFLGCLGTISGGEVDTIGFYLQPGESVEDRCPDMKDMCQKGKTKNLKLINVAPATPSAPTIAVSSFKKVSCREILQSSDCSDLEKGGWTKPGQGPDAGAQPTPGASTATYSSSKASIYQTVAEDCTALKSRCTEPNVKNVEVIPSDGPERAVTLACSELLDKPYCRTVLDRLSREEVQ